MSGVFQNQVVLCVWNLTTNVPIIVPNHLKVGLGCIAKAWPQPGLQPIQFWAVGEDRIGARCCVLHQPPGLHGRWFCVPWDYTGGWRWGPQRCGEYSQGIPGSWWGAGWPECPWSSHRDPRRILQGSTGTRNHYNFIYSSYSHWKSTCKVT